MRVPSDSSSWKRQNLPEGSVHLHGTGQIDCKAGARNDQNRWPGPLSFVPGRDSCVELLHMKMHIAGV